MPTDCRNEMGLTLGGKATSDTFDGLRKLQMVSGLETQLDIPND